MKTDLRPMNLGEILDRTFQIYRAKFWVFAGIAALPALAMMGINLADVSWLHLYSLVHTSPQGAVLWNFVIWLGFFHVSGFLSLLISPAQVHVTSTASLGEGSSIPSALRFTAARWRSYLWITVLKLSAEVVIPEILFLVLIFGATLIAVLSGVINNREVEVSSAWLVFAFPAIAGCFLFFWLGSCFSLAVPAGALEETVGFKAMRRSLMLSKGSRARIMVTWMLVAVFALLLMYGVQLIFRWAFLYLCRGHAFGAVSQHLYLPIAYLLYAIVSILIGPIYPIAITLFYYDQRIRKEGYDIERMMEDAGLNAPVTTLAEVKEGQA
jgi:hypothetical protein